MTAWAPGKHLSDLVADVVPSFVVVVIVGRGVLFGGGCARWKYQCLSSLCCW